jgi:hypothetical protein
MEPDNSDQRDPMGPPEGPCECFCLHCQRVFMSDGMWFQRVINASDGFPGFWLCPTPNCSGAGFCMDIFPTDPDHPANGGWHSSDDESEEEGSDENEEWDPSESKFFDEDEDEFEDEDIQGEEWKFGPAPDHLAADPPPETPAMQAARLEREEEEKRYDMPDERPRVLDWADHDRPARSGGDDDIPF